MYSSPESGLPASGGGVGGGNDGGSAAEPDPSSSIKKCRFTTESSVESLLEDLKKSRVGGRENDRREKHVSTASFDKTDFFSFAEKQT